MSDSQDDFSEVNNSDQVTSDLDREFISIRDDVLIDDAAHRRARVSSLRQQAEYTASLRRFLRDLGETHSAITIHSISGHTYHGVIDILSDRVIRMRNDNLLVWIRVAALSVVQLAPSEKTNPHTVPLHEKHTNKSTLDLTTVLTDLAETHPKIIVHSLGESAPCRGYLRAFGDDVLTLTDEEGSATAYLNLHAITEIELIA